MPGPDVAATTELAIRLQSRWRTATKGVAGPTTETRCPSTTPTLALREAIADLYAAAGGDVLHQHQLTQQPLSAGSIGLAATA